MREQAQVYGYTVVNASTVVATHLNHLVVTPAGELLGRQEVQALLERIDKDTPSLTEDLVPKTISLTTLQKVLQNLLDESAPIRDMRTILDAIRNTRRAFPIRTSSRLRCASRWAARSRSNGFPAWTTCR